MKISFHGVRGSIATPGPETVKYGGNTTCIEIQTKNGDLIILDAGTGIHKLAQSLLNKKPVIAHIFISHTHWDHIQGLPFFMPIFFPGNIVNLYGGIDPVTGQGIERALNVQLQYSYFPIREAELKAKINYTTLTPGQVTEIGQTRITPFVLNHPVMNFGYRVEDDEHSIFFTGDYEPLFNIYSPSDKEFENYEIQIEETLKATISAMMNVDALIIDSSFTPEEYQFKKGWGHGTYDSSMMLATKAKAKQLFFTHHEPCRTDSELDSIFELLKHQNENADLQLIMAKEGISYSI